MQTSYSDRRPIPKDEIHESRVSRMFFASWASAAALLVTHPIDVIKLNQQVKPLTVRQLVKYYYEKDKGRLTIYRGITTSMARSMVNTNLRFELYELARRHNLINTFSEKVKIAAVSGAIGGFFVTPMTRVYVRKQYDDLLPPNERIYYRGMVHGITRIYLEEGFSMLFAGAPMSSARCMMTTIGQLALYDELKLFLLEYPMYFSNDFKTYLIASVVAGCAATFLQQPFEVICTRLMNSRPGKFKGTQFVVNEVSRQYGFKGFYKGLVPGLMRIVPQTVITYMILENLRLRFGMLLRTRQRGDLIEIISIDVENCSADDKKCIEEQRVRELETKKSPPISMPEKEMQQKQKMKKFLAEKNLPLVPRHN